MLVNHTALGMHYVYGIPIQRCVNDAVRPINLLEGSGLPALYGYKRLYLEKPAGSKFSYSGGGFVVLQYLLEEMEQQPIETLTRPFLDKCGLRDFVFSQCMLFSPYYAALHTVHTNMYSFYASITCTGTSYLTNPNLNLT